MPRRRDARPLGRLCDDYGEEDGTDPRWWSPAERRRNDRKLLQLCRQVERALNLALGGESGDPLLRDLFVESVEPAPDSSRLRVRVRGGAGATASGGLQARLQGAAGFLRMQVAGSISRRKVPELCFELVAGEVGS